MVALDPDRLASFLIEEFGQEEVAGFPTLKRVPDTHARFHRLYFSRLSLAERARWLPVMARKALEHFVPMARPLPELAGAEKAVFDDWLNASPTQKMAGPEGWKFMSLKLLKMGVGWQKRFPPKPGEWAFPEDAIRQVDALETAKAADLRRWIKAAFLLKLGLKARSLGGGTWVYERQDSSGSLSVEIDYGHTNGIQLDYAVHVTDAASGVSLRRARLEQLFLFGIGWWDFIIASEIQQSVELLVEIVDYLSKLPARAARAAGTIAAEPLPS